MLATLVALAIAAASVAEPAEAADSTASAFLDAFQQMDAERFDAFFAEDVTLFYPDGPFPAERVDGREAVLATFHDFFRKANERGISRLTIVPDKLHIREQGDTAIVTFELPGDTRVGRRSLIMARQEDGKWRIVHLHASSRDRQPEP